VEGVERVVGASFRPLQERVVPGCPFLRQRGRLSYFPRFLFPRNCAGGLVYVVEVGLQEQRETCDV
jgi:hypothetical protein